MNICIGRPDQVYLFLLENSTGSYECSTARVMFCGPRLSSSEGLLPMGYTILNDRVTWNELIEDTAGYSTCVRNVNYFVSFFQRALTEAHDTKSTIGLYARHRPPLPWGAGLSCGHRFTTDTSVRITGNLSLRVAVSREENYSHSAHDHKWCKTRHAAPSVGCPIGSAPHRHV